MAEQIDLSINIGANTQDLQAELQKAQNLLAQFQSALKKATNVGEINYLNTAITNLQQKIAGLNAQMGNMRKPTADATNALTNLSRVAQDAPYGFMGIANNLNPMLESFQRLQKESGGTGNALKALVGGLTGPAGIGVALGVVSSLIVAFGKDISDFFSKLTSGNESLAKTNNAFHESKQAFIDAYVEMQNLGNAFESFHNGTMSKKQVLDKYNETLGKVYGTTKDINEAEDIYLNNAPKYIQAAAYRAAAQIALTKAAEQAFKQQEAAFNPKAFGGFDLNQFIAAAGLSKLIGTNVGTINEALGSANAIKKGKEQENIFLQIADAFNKMVQETNSSAQKSVLFNKELDKKPKKDTEYLNYLKEYRKELDKQFNTIKQGFGNKKAEQYVDTFVSPKAETPKILSESASSFYKDAQKDNEARTASILLTKEQTEANLKLADTLSNYTANAFMNLWASMEQGMSIGEALGNLFIDLAKQIAAAAIKAAVFQAIFAAVSGGGSAAANATTGGFMNLFKGFLGLASGGIVTKPTLAMVGEGNESEAVMPLSKLSGFLTSSFNAGAMSSTGSNGGQFVLKGSDLVLALQRSNNNLNLRRGV
jgi:hypothetical protein